MYYDEFSDKIVVVTGASSGIGYAVAEAFISYGATVYVLSNEHIIYEVAKELSLRYEVEVTPLLCDVSRVEEMEKAFDDIGEIDVFIANAGIEVPTPINDFSATDKFSKVLDVNIRGTYLSIQYAVPKMGAGSAVIITSSIWGKTAVPEFSSYIASKHANLGLMRTLAKELGPKQIRVNAICPGWVKTQPALASLEKLAVEEGKPAEEILKQLGDEQCFGEVQEPEDVALSYLMLASGLAKNITGQAINADRGAFVG